MVRLSLEAFVQRDEARAMSVLLSDDEVDQLRSVLPIMRPISPKMCCSLSKASTSVTRRQNGSERGRR
jgi:hypothetical protein